MIDTKALRQKILDMAIRGKLVPQDPNDESASVLLERIREEKQRLIKEGKIKKNKNDSVIFKGDDNRYYEKVGGEVKDITDDLPFEIPDSWSLVRLSILCCSASGGSGINIAANFDEFNVTPLTASLFLTQSTITGSALSKKFLVISCSEIIGKIEIIASLCTASMPKIDVFPTVNLKLIKSVPCGISSPANLSLKAAALIFSFVELTVALS